MLNKEKVLADIASVIRIATKEIRKQKSVKSDQMRQLTGLTNSYTRLLFKSEELDNSKLDGDPEYYDKLVEN